LKAIAIYRDGSKQSQPLSTKSETKKAEDAAAAAVVEKIVYKPRRERLPDTRNSVTHKFSISGHEGYISVGLYPDGRPGEVFITMAKEGTTIGGLMDSFGTATSISLQYGVPLEVLVSKFSHTRFEPMGHTTNPDIRIAKSLVDYIFRWLGMKFLPVPITGGPTQGRTILFSIWETRVQDYRAFINSTKPPQQPDFPQDGDHPVVNVRWKDAMAFCAWLTERERAKGEIGPGDVYRLPTDHEWSCAVGLGREEDANKSPYAKNSFTHPPDPGSIERFPWGDTYPPPAMVGNYYGEETNRNPLPKYVALKGYNDGFVRTAPVGSFGANPLGLHDLGGNVSEWCLDLYDPGKVSEPRRILRGASWSFQFVPDLRSAARYDVEPEFWNPSAGFRVFLEVGGE
jgi:heme-degrading monooxygenase HmoA